MINKILLATDGSAPAERAADFCGSLALKYEASVLVLHAFHHVPGILGEPEYSRALYKTLDEAKALVENVAKRLLGLGVAQVETDVVEGNAVHVILDVAGTRKPDLIVMGARGVATWRGVILGSVSMAVTQRAECPVLIVK